MDIQKLTIEVTRRCNMRCSHCLRGEQQPKDIDILHVRKFLENTKGGIIDTLAFSGGEPSLKSDIINNIIDILIDLDIKIGSFYIASNCKKMTDEFINVCNRLYDISINKSQCVLFYSNDYWHDDVSERDKVSLLSYAKKRNIDKEKYNPLNQGRYTEGVNKPGPGYTRIEGNKIYGELYMNINGDLIDGCDWSYDNQENNKFNP